MHLSIFIKSFFIFNQPRQCLELDFFFLCHIPPMDEDIFFPLKDSYKISWFNDLLINRTINQFWPFNNRTSDLSRRESSQMWKILAFYCCVALFSEYLWSFWLLVKQNQSEDILWSAFFTISWRFIDWMIDIVSQTRFLLLCLTESNKFRPLLWIWDNWGQVCAPKKVTKQLGKMH